MGVADFPGISCTTVIFREMISIPDLEYEALAQRWRSKAYAAWF
jgi:hypothetical protein